MRERRYVRVVWERGSVSTGEAHSVLLLLGVGEAPNVQVCRSCGMLLRHALADCPPPPVGVLPPPPRLSLAIGSSTTSSPRSSRALHRRR